MCSKATARWHSVLVRAIFTSCVVLSSSAFAGDAERQQAKRIHDRLAGVPPTNAVLDDMEQDINAGRVTDAAMTAMSNPSFYSVTLKNFAAPWTNEAQDAFVPLNDYTATVIGMIRDNADFRGVLYENVIYVGMGAGVPSYSNSNNANYAKLEAGDPVTGPYNLSSPSTLRRFTQTEVTGLPDYATAGVLTTRAAAEAFFSGGTNRAMFRFTLMNHLCTDLEPLKDVTRVPDRVRRDVSRSPGGDSRVFMNSCVGCHAGMDGMAGAFARYEFNETTGTLQYQAINDKFDVNGVAVKHNINSTNFPHGYITTDDSWVNYWRNGPNSLLKWDLSRPSSGNGAKSLGMELAHSKAFSSCQVKKVFKAVCFRDPDNYSADRIQVNAIANVFETNGNMKTVFASVAAYCTAP